jgi:hypothetical protein
MSNKIYRQQFFPVFHFYAKLFVENEEFLHNAGTARPNCEGKQYAKQYISRRTEEKEKP